MKIVIGYPPLESPKGIPLLGQNRQFQWAKTAWRAYPVVPAYAATMLKNAGHKVFWLDGISEEWTYQKWQEELFRVKPDMLVIETKTPVIKRHWEIINKLKSANRRIKIILVGDHVTALPDESYKNSKVDYVLAGGNYDFSLLSLVEKKQIPVNLDKLPFIDRKLTRWELYAYQNSNYSQTPGTYTMFGRDCWWGRCTFCVIGDRQIITTAGSIPIKTIVEEKMECKVLTNKGKYEQVIDRHERLVDEKIIKISTLYLPQELQITCNHQIHCLPRNMLKHCSQRCGWSYLCKPDRISKFLNCAKCKKKHFLNYQLSSVEAGSLKAGDFLAIPIDREVKEVKQINVEEILERQATIFKTRKKIDTEIIRRIAWLKNRGQSELTISKTLNIDRETVHRYILLIENDTLDVSVNCLSRNEDDRISFKNGHNKIPRSIGINDDFLFLVGLYIAEGHVSYHKDRPNSATLGLTFNKKELDLINKTEVFFKNTFNLTLSKTLNIKNNTCQLYISSTIICRFLKILLGDNCYEKKIPEEFLRLPTEKQRFLLSGIFRGDGHFRERGGKDCGSEYVLETTSKILADQVFMMLFRFNALPSYKCIPPRLKNEAVKYKITLFRKDIPKVFPEMKFRDNSKITHKKGFILGNTALIPIIKVTKTQFKGYVYNLTVENDHSYTANFVAVRNCSWTTLYPGKAYRVMFPKRALDEIGDILENYPVKEIMDDSGTFPVGAWLKEFCGGMIDRGYNKKIKLDGNMRFNNGLRQQDYNLMAKAGFRFLLFGLESANQRTLDRLSKNLKVVQIKKTLKMAKKAGLCPSVSVMVGYPWETKREVLNTLSLARDLFRDGLIDTLQATTVVPYPGTPLFDEAKKNGWLKTLNWDEYDMKTSVLKTPLSEGEISGLVKDFFGSIWSPQFVARKLKEGFTDWNRFKQYCRFALKFFSKRQDFRV